MHARVVLLEQIPHVTRSFQLNNSCRKCHVSFVRKKNSLFVVDVAMSSAKTVSFRWMYFRHGIVRDVPGRVRGSLLIDPMFTKEEERKVQSHTHQ